MKGAERAKWKTIADATTSDDLLLAVKNLLHETFDARYVVVFVVPEEPQAHLESEFDLEVVVVGAPESFRQEEGNLYSRVHEPRRRYITPETLLEEVIGGFVEKGVMETQGLDCLVHHFFVEDRYVGFVAMYRKEPFQEREKRSFRRMFPYLQIALRASQYMSVVEDIPRFAFGYMVSHLSRKYGLTPYERYVLREVLRGQDLKLIAQKRGTTVFAIKKVVRSIYRKTGVKRRGELLQRFFSGR